MKKSTLATLKKVLYPLIAVGLLYWVYLRIDPAKTYDQIKEANYGWVLLASFVALMSHFVRAVRWKMLIEPMGYKGKTSTSFYAVIIGYAVNFLTPRMGEVARCAVKSKVDGMPVDKLVGTVVTERVFDLVVTLLITIAAFFFQYDLIGDFFTEQLNQNGGGNSTKLILLGGFLVLSVAGLFVLGWLKKRENNPPFLQKIINFVSGLLDGAKSIFKLKNPLLFVGMTLLIWVLYFATPYLLFLSVEGTAHLGFDAALTTLIVATMAIIIPAPGGIGSFHYFVPLGLVLYNIDINVGTSYAIISHTSHMVMIFVAAGVVSVIMARDRRKKRLNESV